MVRVRFAPSPTGPLHIGGVRTALYNYLFARRAGGTFILRIEDTDTARYVPGAEEYILQSLRWCGIEIDEGVGALRQAQDGALRQTQDGALRQTQDGAEGPHAPYRQSERRDIYIRYARELVERGAAYYAFDTAEELEKLRAEAGETFAYNYKVRERLATSLRLPAEEVAARIARGDQYVVRFLMPADRDVAMQDLIRGEVVINSGTLDDKVLWKSADGLPTYHLANIVDDHLMEISHVIRGEEWLPSLPLHYLLYEAFGWTSTQPQFAHLPLLLKPTGQGKLSKRDGDKMGFPVFPLRWIAPDGAVSAGYREDGYFPEAFINMLALLGWNPGTEREIFSLPELVEQFSLDRVSKSGARFQPEKARWFNHEYMLRRPDAAVAEAFEEILAARGVVFERPVLERIVGLVKERATFVGDLWELSAYFFVAPEAYDEKAAAKFWKGENPARVKALRELLASADDFSAAALETLIHEAIAQREWPMGQVMNSLRLAIVGASMGPGLAEICEIIGKAETLDRLDRAFEKL